MLLFLLLLMVLFLLLLLLVPLFQDLESPLLDVGGLQGEGVAATGRVIGLAAMLRVARHCRRCLQLVG